jgi:hypothetical protein
MHLAVTLGALAFPLVLRRLVVRLGGDPWWALLGVPVVLGFPFAWGFLNFFLVLPLMLLTLERAIAWAEAGRRRDGWWLGLLGLACLAGHFLAWSWTVGAGLCLIQLRGGLDLRTRLVRSVPLLAGAPLAAAWLVQVWSLPGTPQLPTGCSAPARPWRRAGSASSRWRSSRGHAVPSRGASRSWRWRSGPGSARSAWGARITPASGSRR